MTPLSDAIARLAFLDRDELAALAGEVVLRVGMVAPIAIVIPPPVESVSWAECWKRGVAAISSATETV